MQLNQKSGKPSQNVLCGDVVRERQKKSNAFAPRRPSDPENSQISIGGRDPPLSYTTIKNALMAHFEPLANPDHKRFLLRQARQQPEESDNAFYAPLWELASIYTLQNAQDEIRAQFI
ncbi:hypothetical protein NDU88_002153 [Pleurodeles waltl]|uniref:Uncharacterized protein n=1 Tax=Pleurodeles waltl TaxID=8319 RepID=A0AAV7WKK8_PLEWA|nr:hypothetical protein NDU88_002153 [Pleurodeles waltl]